MDRVNFIIYKCEIYSSKIQSKIMMIFSQLSICFFLFYVFSYQFWIELWGINNPVRYAIYVLTFICMGIQLVIEGKKNAILMVFFFFYLIYVLLNYLISPYSESVLYLYNYIFVVFVFMGGMCITKSYINIIFLRSLVFFLGTFASCICIYEFLFSRLFFSGSSEHEVLFSGLGVVRAVSVYGSPIICGLMSALVFTCIFATKSKSIFRLIGLGINGVAVLCSLSRGPMVAMVVGVVVTQYLKIGRRSERVIIIFIVIILILIVWLAFSVLEISSDNIFIYRIASIFNFTSEGGNLSRISVWTSVFEKTDNIFWGNGIGALNETGFGVTESGVLSLFFEAGLIGVLLYFIPFIYILLKAASNCLKSQKYRMYCLFSLAMVVVILTDNITLQVLQSLIVQIIFGLCCAIMVNQNNKFKKRI